MSDRIKSTEAEAESKGTIDRHFQKVEVKSIIGNQK